MSDRQDYDLLTDLTAELWANRLMIGRLLQAVSQLADDNGAWIGELRGAMRRDAAAFTLNGPTPDLERQALIRALIAQKLDLFLAGMPTDSGDPQ